VLLKFTRYASSKYSGYFFISKFKSLRPALAR